MIITTTLIISYISPSYSARYTFSGKERDEESGFSYFGARYYNSAYSIWLSVDPMTDKYPSLSPYAYCGNNPVKLVDANGEEIVIKDGNHYYTYRNGSLFLNNKEVSIDKNSFAGKTLKSLNLINRTEMGRTMISDLQKTENEGGKTITITAGTKSKFDLQSGTLLWNTNGSKVPLFHEVAFEDAPMDLAHELSHAYDYNNDWTDRTETSGLERSEWVACYRENRVRSELVKPRAYREYYKVIRTPEGKYGGGTGPRLLNKDNLPFLPFSIDSYEKK